MEEVLKSSSSSLPWGQFPVIPQRRGGGHPFPLSTPIPSPLFPQKYITGCLLFCHKGLKNSKIFDKNFKNDKFCSVPSTTYYNKGGGDGGGVNTDNSIIDFLYRLRGNTHVTEIFVTGEEGRHFQLRGGGAVLYISYKTDNIFLAIRF